MNDTAVQNLEIHAEVSSSTQDTPGTYLSSLRKEEGLTQSQVAESLHLTVHYVNALENDEYHKLPGKIFVKGYLKSYALLMNVAVDPVVKSFELLSSERNDFPQDLVTIQSKFKSYRHGYVWFILAGLLLVGVAAVSWFFWSGGQQESPQVQQGLVPDYLRAAEDNKQEVVVSIPVGNQIYTVRRSDHLPEGAMTGKKSTSSGNSEGTNNQSVPQKVQSGLKVEEQQPRSTSSTTGRLEG